MKQNERPAGTTGTRDGRNIDADLGWLVGEGAQITVEGKPSSAYPTLKETLEKLPTQAESSAAETGYYGQPVIKEPVWIWAIPTYFYVGGVAGAACMTAAVASGRCQ